MDEGVAGSLDAFDDSLDDVEAALKPFLTIPLDTIAAEVSPGERARVNFVYSYAIYSLLYMYLRTQGIETKDHPIRKALERIQPYKAKIDAVQGTGPKPSIRVDVPAAGRFIQAALAANSAPAEEAAGTDAAPAPAPSPAKRSKEPASTKKRSRK